MRNIHKSPSFDSLPHVHRGAYRASFPRFPRLELGVLFLGCSRRPMSHKVEKTCLLALNIDISGIGVRVAFYVQVFLTGRPKFPPCNPIADGALSRYIYTPKADVDASSWSMTIATFCGVHISNRTAQNAIAIILSRYPSGRPAIPPFICNSHVFIATRNSATPQRKHLRHHDDPAQFAYSKTTEWVPSYPYSVGPGAYVVGDVSRRVRTRRILGLRAHRHFNNLGNGINKVQGQSKKIWIVITTITIFVGVEL